MLATKQPTNSHMSLAGGMLPGSTVINNLKRKLDILEGSGHNSACGSFGGFGWGGGLRLGWEIFRPFNWFIKSVRLCGRLHNYIIRLLYVSKPRICKN
jgi:hypothetical protein